MNVSLSLRADAFPTAERLLYDAGHRAGRI
jgi:hypothetical protein